MILPTPSKQLCLVCTLTINQGIPPKTMPWSLWFLDDSVCWIRYDMIRYHTIPYGDSRSWRMSLWYHGRIGNWSMNLEWSCTELSTVWKFRERHTHVKSDCWGKWCVRVQTVRLTTANSTAGLDFEHHRYPSDSLYDRRAVPVESFRKSADTQADQSYSWMMCWNTPGGITCLDAYLDSRLIRWVKGWIDSPAPTGQRLCDSHGQFIPYYYFCCCEQRAWLRFEMRCAPTASFYPVTTDYLHRKAGLGPWGQAPWSNRPVP